MGNVKVIIVVHGYLDKKFINIDKEIKIKKGSSAKDLLSKISKDIKVDLLTLLAKGGPVAMINTERLEIPKDLSRQLIDRDEILILQPMSGG